MTNKNDQLVVGLYADEDAALAAIDEIKDWDKQDKDVKLGAIAAITYNAKKDKLEYKEKGQRSTKSGAGWGTALGATVARLLFIAQHVSQRPGSHRGSTGSSPAGTRCRAPGDTVQPVGQKRCRCR